jgi:hypothetical protein
MLRLKEERSRMIPRALGSDQAHPHPLANDRMVARKLLDLLIAHAIQAPIATSIRSAFCKDAPK